MAESDNVAVIGQIYEAFGRGDINYIIDQLTDDVRWVSHLEAVVPWSGDFSGKTNVPKFFEAIDGSVQTTSFTPRDFIAQADSVVSTGEYGCTVNSTGKTSLTPWVFIWKLRDGKVSSYEQFHDPTLAEAFR